MGTTGIKLQQQLALMSVIYRYRSEKFSWGKYDCHTFIADCYDAMFNTDTAAAFKGKYSTMSGAIRYYKKNEAYDVWLEKQGYTLRLDTTPAFGDVIAIRSKYYTRGSIYIDGCVSMTEWGSLGITPYNSDPQAGNEIWRYKWER